MPAAGEEITNVCGPAGLLTFVLRQVPARPPVPETRLETSSSWNCWPSGRVPLNVSVSVLSFSDSVACPFANTLPSMRVTRSQLLVPAAVQVVDLLAQVLYSLPSRPKSKLA